MVSNLAAVIRRGAALVVGESGVQGLLASDIVAIAVGLAIALLAWLTLRFVDQLWMSLWTVAAIITAGTAAVVILAGETTKRLRPLIAVLVIVAAGVLAVTAFGAGGTLVLALVTLVSLMVIGLRRWSTGAVLSESLRAALRVSSRIAERMQPLSTAALLGGIAWLVASTFGPTVATTLGAIVVGSLLIVSFGREPEELWIWD